MTNHIYIFVSILFTVCSQLIIKWTMSSVSLDNYNSTYEKFLFMLSMLINPFIIVSLIMTLLAGLSWMIAMTKYEISYAYPFTTLGFVLILLFSAILFNEPITKEKTIGLILIITGIIISSRSL